MDTNNTIPSKYPYQVSAYIKGESDSTFTLSVNEVIELPGFDRETLVEDPPLEMFAKYSVFNVDILKKMKNGGHVSVTSNIRLDQLAMLNARTKFAEDKIIEAEMNGPTEELEPCYSVKIRMGKFKDMSPAEVLLANPTNETELFSVRDLLAQNVERYPSNQRVIDAINQAIIYSREDKLNPNLAKSATKVIKILETKMPKNKKNIKKDGKDLCYKINIYCYPGDDYPYEIVIENLWADVSIRNDKRQKIDLAGAEDMTRLSMRLTEAQWTDLLDMMTENKKAFRYAWYPTQKTKAYNAYWFNRNNNQSQ